MSMSLQLCFSFPLDTLFECYIIDTVVSVEMKASHVPSLLLGLLIDVVTVDVLLRRQAATYF